MVTDLLVLECINLIEPFDCSLSLFISNEQVQSYPAKKYDRTQRMGRGLPNGQGTMLPSSWVQDDPTAGYKTHEKGHQNDVIMNIMFNLNSDSQC